MDEFPATCICGQRFFIPLGKRGTCPLCGRAMHANKYLGNIVEAVGIDEACAFLVETGIGKLTALAAVSATQGRRVNYD